MRLLYQHAWDEERQKKIIILYITEPGRAAGWGGPGHFPSGPYGYADGRIGASQDNLKKKY
jgi:hypothetical protein